MSATNIIKYIFAHITYKRNKISEAIILNILKYFNYLGMHQTFNNNSTAEKTFGKFIIYLIYNVYLLNVSAMSILRLPNLDIL